MKIFGRDPVLFSALVAAFLNLVSAFFTNWDIAMQGYVNAAVLAVAGLVVVWRVSYEKGLALLSGVASTLMALVVAFGYHLSPEGQSSILLFIGMAVAFWLRGQVTAPIDIYGNDVAAPKTDGLVVDGDAK